jgi:hypothetical protein
MAIGMSQGGGILSTPSVPGLGQDEWALLSGANPGDPLIGGYVGRPGFGTPVPHVSTNPNNNTAIAQGAPTAKHWSGAFDFKNNPISWIMLGALVLWASHTKAGGLVKRKL